MIVVRLMGGLGNQLFQYAFGRRIALLRQEKLLLDISVLGAPGDTYRHYGLNKFLIEAEIANPEQIRKIKHPLGLISKTWQWFEMKVLRHFHIGYESHLLNSEVLYFEGYFQSYKYLEPIKEKLITELTLRDPLSSVARDILSKIDSTCSVSLHVRRGDYVHQKNDQYHTFGMEYYKQAIKFFKERYPEVVFYVFSDDAVFVREKFKKMDYDFFYVSEEKLPDYEELVLMSKCRHNIIANSSFSFWGAWLNLNSEKLVIAPKLWCKKFKREFRDLLPESWLKI